MTLPQPIGPNIHPPLTFFVGDMWELDFPCEQSDGTPFDLTNATIVWKLADFNDNILFALTVGSGVAIVQPTTAGECIVTLSGTQSGTLSPETSYKDQLEVTDANGNGPFVLASGRIDTLKKI